MFRIYFTIQSLGDVDFLPYKISLNQDAINLVVSPDQETRTNWPNGSSQGVVAYHLSVWTDSKGLNGLIPEHRQCAAQMNLTFGELE